MKTIVLNVQDLKDRASQLRLLKSEYESCQLKLNNLIDQMETTYIKDRMTLLSNELNLSMTMMDMAGKLGKLASLLEERAVEIENENRHS